MILVVDFGVRAKTSSCCKCVITQYKPSRVHIYCLKAQISRPSSPSPSPLFHLLSKIDVHDDEGISNEQPHREGTLLSDDYGRYDADSGVALTDAVARPGLSVCREPRVLATLSYRAVFCVAGSWD